MDAPGIAFPTAATRETGPGHALPMHRWILALFWLITLCSPLRGSELNPDPAPLLAAGLSRFRSEVPKGWSYRQTTTAEGQSIVERHDGARPEFDRWSLVRKNDREPTDIERREYLESRSRRSRAGTAPRLAEQIDSAGAELLHEDPERVTYRCRLRPGDAGDRTAAFLRARIVIHRATATIEILELHNTAPFRPTFGVKIEEMLTRLTFTLPEGDTPSLPFSVETRVRGTAFWFKSLDAAMTIRFSDYARVTRPR